MKARRYSAHEPKCQTPPKTLTEKRTNGQTDKETNGQTLRIEFGAF